MSDFLHYAGLLDVVLLISIPIALLACMAMLSAWRRD